MPIVILSVRGEERTKVQALDAGADDYVTKPFGMEELLARVRAALRRSPSEASPQLETIELGDFMIDTAAHKVSVKGRDVHLTPKEFDLLVYLARHAGKLLTHRTLLGAIWGGESTEQVEYLRVFVGQLGKNWKPRRILALHRHRAVGGLSFRARPILNLFSAFRRSSHDGNGLISCCE